jgi:hypothetical protein
MTLRGLEKAELEAARAPLEKALWQFSLWWLARAA